MSTNTMLALGDFVFELNSAAFERAERSSNYDWQAQKLVKSYPSLQYLGEGVEQLGLSGVIYPSMVGAASSLDELRAMAQAGIAYALTGSDGKPRGDWVIKAIRDEHTLFLSNGKARKISFTLQLERYSHE